MTDKEYIANFLKFDDFDKKELKEIMEQKLKGHHIVWYWAYGPEVDND